MEGAASPDSYRTISRNPVSAEIKVKGSRFIAHIIRCDSREEAESEYALIRKKYYDATHNCVAWRIDADEFRFSDDGEPSGTAGRPILNAIESMEIFQVMVVVTRYFGGTKLGSGGLFRAYGDAALEGLKQAKIELKTRLKSIGLVTGYGHLKDVHHLIGKYDGRIGNEDYAGEIHLTVQIPLSRFDPFRSEIETMRQRGFLHIENE